VYETLFKYLAVAGGGAIGSMLRFGIGGFIQNRAGVGFPLGTLAVNLVGCLVIGVLFALFTGPLAGKDSLRVFLMIGVLGGFTTFSTFSLETLNLLAEGQTGRACLNIAISVVAGLAATFVGLKAGQMLFNPVM
jgi:CrcB protein